MLGSRRFYAGQIQCVFTGVVAFIHVNSSFFFTFHTNSLDKPVGEFDISVKYQSMYTSEIVQKPFPIVKNQSQMFLRV